jgi:superfamily II DNA or RNA helicase
MGVDVIVLEDAVGAACDCGYPRCKHLWAVLVVAEERGLLSELTFTPREWIRLRDLDPKERDELALEGRYPAWRRLFREVREKPRPTGTFPPEAVSEIVYLGTIREGVPESFQVRLGRRSRKPDGSWGPVKLCSINSTEAALFSDPDDRRLLQLLARPNEGLSYSYLYRAPSVFPLNDAQVGLFVPELCRSGRFYLAGPKAEACPPGPLAWDEGEPWDLVLRVTPEGQGDYLLWGALARGVERMDLSEALYLHPSGVCFTPTRAGRYRSKGADGWIGPLLRRGPIPIRGSEAEAFLKGLHATEGGTAVELPAPIRPAEVRSVPRPRLRLFDLDGSSSRPMLGTTLSFLYDDVAVDGIREDTEVYDADTRRLVVRDPAKESEARKLLRDLGFRPTEWPVYGRRVDYELPAARMLEAVSRLLDQGWVVEGKDCLYRPPGRISLSVSSGVDWFDLEGGVEYGTETVSFPRLLKALRSGERFVRLGDGSVGLLPEDWLRRTGILLGTGQAEGEVLRFQRSQAILLGMLLESERESRADPDFRKIREKLETFEKVEWEDPPPSFQGSLRPYQKSGLAWMRFLRDFGLGGCLADDMGLGKTVQLLAYLETRRRARAGPSLVVVPRSLLFNWKAETARFAPKLRLVEHAGPGRAKDAGSFEKADLVLTTYGTLRNDAPFLKDVDFDCVVLDEAQAIKNPVSVSAQAARLLKGRQRLALTGTPIENRLGELWSLMEFLNPGMLGKASVFEGVLGSDASPDREQRKLLARALRPFLLRRRKEEVAPELPAKVEQTLFIDLEPEERGRYDELREYYRRRLLEDRQADWNEVKFHILEALLRLRQAACHPGLLHSGMASESSSKLEVLLERLREVVAEGHKALVFSQFTSLLAILRRRLEREEIPYAYLDGQTRDRRAPVERFQTDPDCRLFLVSLKAGGVGLNLTAAEYVFLLDPWWNPAVEAQAIDRTHRIGQERRVFALRLVARDTVEEKVIELQKSKRELADAILGQEGGLLRDLTRDDLALILS